MENIYELVKDFKARYPRTIAWRIDKHSKVIDDYINPDEKVLYAFCGQKNDSWADIFTSAVIVLTNKRLLIGQKRVFWGSFYTQVTPDLYNDLQIYRGLIFGRLTIDTVKEKIVITNLSNKALDEIETAISQFMMREKKKYRDNHEETS